MAFDNYNKFEDIKKINKIYNSVLSDKKWILVDNKVLLWCGYLSKNKEYKYKQRYLELLQSTFNLDHDYKLLNTTEFNNVDKKTINIIIETDSSNNGNKTKYLIVKPECFKESLLMLKTDRSKELQSLIMLREIDKGNNCYYIGCRNKSSYLNGKFIYCSEHSIDTRYNMNSKNCLYCFKEPSYNFKHDKEAVLCFDHKEVGMINTRIKYCKLCSYTQSHGIFKPYCSGCYYFMNPNSDITRNYKVKENSIMKIVKEKYQNCILDSIVSGGCSRRRPDGLIEFPLFSIIIEIDENSHSNYEKICENRRIMEIFTDLGNRPLCVIRFNPDSFIDSNNVKKKSLFHMINNKLIIRCKEEFNRRINILLEEIDNSISFMSNNLNNKNIDIKHLFY